MKKLSITLSSLLIAGLLFIQADFQKTVYICKGPASTKYHLDRSCRGLARCSTGAYAVDLQKAKEMDRTLCGWED